jgi:hypothetical protein
VRAAVLPCCRVVFCPALALRDQPPRPARNVVTRSHLIGKPRGQSNLFFPTHTVLFGFLFPALQCRVQHVATHTHTTENDCKQTTAKKKEKKIQPGERRNRRRQNERKEKEQRRNARSIAATRPGWGVRRLPLTEGDVPSVNGATARRRIESKFDRDVSQSRHRRPRPRRRQRKEKNKPTTARCNSDKEASTSKSHAHPFAPTHASLDLVLVGGGRWSDQGERRLPPPNPAA